MSSTVRLIVSSQNSMDKALRRCSAAAFRRQNGTQLRLVTTWSLGSLPVSLVSGDRPHPMTRILHQQPTKLLTTASTGGKNEVESKEELDSEKDESSTHSTETSNWIRPDRPLVGDQAQSSTINNRDHDDRGDDQPQEPEFVSFPFGSSVPGSSTTLAAADWLATRRRVLGSSPPQASKDSHAEEISDDDDQENTSFSSAALLHPPRLREGRVSREMPASLDLPVHKHQLLSKQEIVQFLDSMGTRDITVIFDDPDNRRMGGNIGMIIVTASSIAHVRIAAQGLVRQLRRRALQEVGVEAAHTGRRALKMNDTWIVLDLRNYEVHIFDEPTREAVNLEAIWSGQDLLHTLNLNDEDAVEDYIAANPVPDGYGEESFDIDERLRQLQRNRWTAPHRPVVKRARKGRRRR